LEEVSFELKSEIEMWIEQEWEAQWNTVCQVEMNERQVDGVL